MSPRAASSRTVITPRDTEVLASLAEYRYLTVSQIERLHFPSAQTARRRLRLLAKVDVMRLIEVATIPERVAALTIGGAEAPSSNSGHSAQPAGGRPQNPIFLQHHLAAAEFRIRLSAGCAKRTDHRLAGFLPEHLMRPRGNGQPTKYLRDEVPPLGGEASLWHTPDGVFGLQRSGQLALFFLEVDRGTEREGSEARCLACGALPASAPGASAHQASDERRSSSLSTGPRADQGADFPDRGACALGLPLPARLGGGCRLLGPKSGPAAPLATHPGTAPRSVDGRRSGAAWLDARALRWGELARAKSSDVEGGTLLVHQTKTGRVRRVPLTPELQSELRRRVGKLKELTGIGRFHPHQMRHTFACQWLERGGSLAALQQILGHSTIVTTQRYARLTDEAVMAEAMRLAQGGGDER